MTAISEHFWYLHHLRINLCTAGLLSPDGLFFPFTCQQVFLDFIFIGNTPLTVPDVPPDMTTTVSVTLIHIWEGINPFK
jgi:hypothetical protein